MEKQFTQKNRGNVYLYRHIKLSDNKVFYIGIGSYKRSQSKKSRNDYWKGIVAKHGYYVEILKKNLSWSEASELEKILISYYGRKDNKTGILANMTDGGDGTIGWVQSEETKIKRSITNSGKTYGRIYKKKERLVISETEKAIRKELSSLKRRESALKRGISEETRFKMKNSRENSSYVVSSETRKKMSDTRKGKIKPQIYILNSNTGVFHHGHKEAYNSYSFKCTEDGLRAKINRGTHPFLINVS